MDVLKTDRDRRLYFERYTGDDPEIGPPKDPELPEDERVYVPSVTVVCWRCGGRGVHDHPAFSDGLTAEDFDRDPDFREDYLRGVYDVCCSVCHGRNVTEDVAWDSLSPELAEELGDLLDEEAAYEAEREAERRMGA